MSDKTKVAILNALDQLASAKPARTDGKINGVNLAKEAGVSKATLYRYLEQHLDLRERYDNLRRNVRVKVDITPLTTEQALRLASEEVNILRTQLTTERHQSGQTLKLKTHQILLLWRQVEHLREDNDRLLAALSNMPIPLKLHES